MNAHNNIILKLCLGISYIFTSIVVLIWLIAIYDKIFLGNKYYGSNGVYEIFIFILLGVGAIKVASYFLRKPAGK